VNIDTAFQKIQRLEGIPLGQLFKDDSRAEVANGHKNKGWAGQVLELVIGLKLSGKLNDLDDGEVKTTNVKNNLTKESIPITVLNHLLDEMMNKVPWKNSKVHQKVKKFILVPVIRDSSDWKSWTYGSPILVSEDKLPLLYSKFEEDYDYISSKIRETIQQKELLHTINGPNYLLQIRTKDNPPYHPFKYNGQVIGNKKHAIFFTSRFVRDLVNFHRGTSSANKSSKDSTRYFFAIED
jgi:DNA mismatch repair protein MutH